MAAKLKNIVIKEISLVDSPANIGARVLLTKRHEPKQTRDQDMILKWRFDEAGQVIGLTNEDGKFVHHGIYQNHIGKGQSITFDKSGNITSAGNKLTEDKGNQMDAIKKALGLPAEATDEDVISSIAARDLELDLAKAAMTGDERSYHDGLSDDAAKRAFRESDHAQRDERMRKAADLPEYVKKALAEAEDLRKRLSIIEDEREQSRFEKLAVDRGLQPDDGALLRKAYSGDAASIDKMVAMIGDARAATETAGAFAEFGTARGKTGNAYDELTAKAEELRKGETTLTQEQAFAKVYGDPANRDLVARERHDNRPIAN